MQEENIKKTMGNKEHHELLKQNKIRIEVKLDRDYNSRTKWNEDKMACEIDDYININSKDI